MLLALPGVRADALLGSLLAYRGVYYLVPLVSPRCCSAPRNCRPSVQRSPAHELASLYIVRWCRRSPAALTFLAGALLLFSGATPALDERLAFLTSSCRSRPEVSHLGASIVAWAAGAGGARCSAACGPPITFRVCLLIAGMFASLLKGLRFRGSGPARPGPRRADAGGRRAFLPTYGDSLERFTPAGGGELAL